ncbi:MAG: hypothetical protein M3362_20765, partial [Acidobacteriota bacterium]|nr:hypothetical protein [Acidobacteriota bacterium]
NQRTGIFRYKNQAGIETEPISVNGELIGFQSKFFEAKINHQEIKDSIQKAKDKNPALNKIYFYINQEFSESSVKGRKEPQQKVEIETFAKAKGLEIVWRVPSHIEAQLSLDENRALATYFFSLEKGVLDFLSKGGGADWPARGRPLARRRSRPTLTLRPAKKRERSRGRRPHRG